MTTATEETTIEKQPAKRKVGKAQSSEPKPPRIPPFINGTPFSEITRVPLKPAEFTSKTHVMLEVAREKTNLEAEFEKVKADYKHRIKSKAEEIIEIQGVLQSQEEKTDVAFYWRYFPKRQLKKKINAATGKVVGQPLPMTKDELKAHAQPALLDVPAQPKPSTEPVPPAAAADVLPAGAETTAPPTTGKALEQLTTGEDGKVQLAADPAPTAPAAKAPKKSKPDVFVPPTE